MIPETHREPIPGLQFWTNQNNVRVCRLHYRADPEKTEGWADKAAAKYPGGRKGSAWRMEMEIEPYAYAGQLVYPEFTVQTHVVQPWELPRDWPAFRTIDTGVANPFACLWVRLSPEGIFYVYREHYEVRWSLEKHISRIKGMTGQEEIEYTVIDPIAGNETLASENTVSEQIAELGIPTCPGNHDVHAGITAVHRVMMIQEWGRPRVQVFSTCTNFIREHLNYRYQKPTEKQAAMKNVSEQPMKVNDHTCDAFRYLVMGVPLNYGATYGIWGTPESRAVNDHERILRQVVAQREWD